MTASLTTAIASGGTVLGAVVAATAGYLGARRGAKAGRSLAAPSACGITASACTRSWPRGYASAARSTTAAAQHACEEKLSSWNRG